MDWSKVGEWLQNNAGAGAALVGSLLTGNVPGAVAAGVSLVSSATGMSKPEEVLAAFQNNPETVLKLKALALQDEQNIRLHIQEMTRMKLEDQQAEHEQTQLTIRGGDVADDPFVRRTRPLQSWLSLIAGTAYAFVSDDPDAVIFGLFLTLPWTYAGLRGVDKAIDAIAMVKGRKLTTK